MAENKIALAHRCRECSSKNIELEKDAKGYYIRCYDCGYYSESSATVDEAIEAWNRRAKDGR